MLYQNFINTMFHVISVLSSTVWGGVKDLKSVEEHHPPRFKYIYISPLQSDR